MSIPCTFGMLFCRCVFVDAGVAAIDVETMKMKEEMKLKEVQSRAVAEHGDLALIAVESSQTAAQDRIKLRPPMLQVDNFMSTVCISSSSLLEYCKLLFRFPLACRKSLAPYFSSEISSV